MEAGAGIEPAMEVLQTSALPLGHPALDDSEKGPCGPGLERETGFEPATSTLARLRSTN